MSLSSFRRRRRTRAATHARRAAVMIALYLLYLALLPLHRTARIAGVVVTRTELGPGLYVVAGVALPPLEAAQALVTQAPLLAVHWTLGRVRETWRAGRVVDARVRELRVVLGAGRVSQRSIRLASVERGSVEVVTITYTAPSTVEVPSPVKFTEARARI